MIIFGCAGTHTDAELLRLTKTTLTLLVFRYQPAPVFVDENISAGPRRLAAWRCVEGRRSELRWYVHLTTGHIILILTHTIHTKMAHLGSQLAICSSSRGDLLAEVWTILGWCGCHEHCQHCTAYEPLEAIMKHLTDRKIGDRQDNILLTPT